MTTAMIRADASNAQAILAAARPQLEELGPMFTRAAALMSHRDPRDSQINNWALSLARVEAALEALKQLRLVAEDMLDYGLTEEAVARDKKALEFQRPMGVLEAATKPAAAVAS